MKYLITGISGFVGGYYIEYLFKKKPDVEIIGIDANLSGFGFLEESLRKRIELCKSSLLDKSAVSDLVEKSRPDYIVNLASYSSVAYSWKNPATCFINNTNIFLNLIEAVRNAGLKARILSIGSSEEYGVVDKKDIPLTEGHRLNPANPYAVARVAQERISQVYASGYGIPIICTRSFNHIGPRQKDIFAVGSFAKQIVEGKSGRRNKITCGNLNIVRDFIDVRDVVRAYDLILQKGKVGEVYNVCSGEGHRLSEILDMLQEKAGSNMRVETDTSLVRPVDNPVIVGSCEKLKSHTGFRSRYNLSSSLNDILEYWQNSIR